jgi:hypothetical protein
MENTEQLVLPTPSVTPMLTEETYTKLVEAFQAIGEAVVKTFEAVAAVISEVVSSLVMPTVQELMKKLYKIVAPPKLYHLAYYSKKGRTRKKNLKRIKRYWEEFINGCHKVY